MEKVQNIGTKSAFTPKNNLFFRLKKLLVSEQFGDPILVTQVLVQKVPHNEFW